MSGILARRLRAHRLTGEPFATAVDAVGWMGAVQSQDYGAGLWALGQRTRAATEAALDALVADGSILRTHVLRPTWHFVLPRDIRWMLELTGPRIRRGLNSRHRELGIDAHTVARSHHAIASALAGGRQLTRTELDAVLRAAGIETGMPRLTHLVMSAELDGVIASGARRGKQFTYALLDDRAPRTASLERADAIRELAVRYFRSHGPAQVQDFVWWSGLTVADARAGITDAGPALGREVVGGEELWFDAGAERPPPAGGIAHLLPNFDEYTVAYRDRTAIHAGRAFDPAHFSYGNVLSNIVTIGGEVRAAWRRVAASSALRVAVLPLDPLDAEERAAIAEAARRLAGFLARDVRLDWRS